ncbi:MAG: sialidase family protein [Blastocatellia bacterium]
MKQLGYQSIRQYSLKLWFLALLLASLVLVAGAQVKAPARQRNGTILSEDFSGAALPPRLPHTVVYSAPEGGRRVHTPNFIEGKDGVLFASWLDYPPPGGKVPSDMDSSNRIVFSASADGGRTWSAPREIDDSYSINPSLLRAPGGDIWVFYNKKNSDAQDDNSIWYTRTNDNGATWSEKRKLEFGYRAAIIVQNGIVLKNGDWLMTLHYDRGNQDGSFEYRRVNKAAGALISTDRGATWKLYGEVEVPNLEGLPNIRGHAVEPAAVETRDGRLLMFIRSKAGYLFQSVSYDHGRTWTEAERMRFSNPNTKAAALTLASGHIALVWNNAQVIDYNKKRFPLMASLSKDDGRTWQYTITINDDQVPLHYQSVIDANGEIKIVHGHNLKEIRVLSLRESDLLYRWTAINKREAWRITGGVLQMTDDRDIPSPYEWNKWAKVISFLPEKPRQFVLEADVRFDGEANGDGAIGVFFSYQDEDNSLAWVWSPGKGEIGMEKQHHFGETNQPASYRASKKTWFEHFKPQPGKWYRVRVTQREDHLKWELMERGQDKALSSATVYTRYDGHFIALGALRVRASFDNLTLKSLATNPARQ